MTRSTEKAKETARKEIKSEPFESLIDEIINEKIKKGISDISRSDYFEIPDKMVMFYKYSYGQQSFFFKELMDNAELYGARCKKCRRVYFPPRLFCSECFSENTWTRISKEGTVLSSTTSWYATSEFFNKVPYAVAYVKPTDADTAILQRIDLKDRDFVEPGTKVRAKFKDVRKGTVSDFWYEIVE